MKEIFNIIVDLFVKNGFVMAFLIVGIVAMFSNFISAKVTRGRIHSSAIAIFLGLILAYIGGRVAGGSKGLSDIPIFTGIGVLGGSTLRDFTIISTAYGAKLSEIKKSGLIGVISLFLGIVLTFIIGALVSVAFGYRDSASVTTIAAGAVTFIVGPVTGAAVGASSDVVAISIATGVLKSIAVMLLTPVLAKKIGLKTPRAAMVFGGLMGTTSGVSAGLAATDPKLVPYGAMTATFYTGLGCLLCPSVLYFLVNIFLP
ncbi:MAG: malonate transporter subunit MadM [Oscillospiraceae bacterium]|nr:malonate transporter subunit MadM [Oscillospiraceae bacterium]